MAKGLINSVSFLGHTPVPFADDARLPADLDVVLTIGPLASLVPLANQLIACPRERRPRLALIHTEPFPNPELPEWFRYGLGRLRSNVERAIYRETSPGEWRVSPLMRRLVGRAHRYRYYGDLFWLRDEGVLSALGVWSRVVAGLLRARGLDPVELSGGYQLDWGKDLGLERDVPVLWLGKPVSRRRRRLLARLRQELREQDVEMLVVDGVEHPYVFGEERTRLLNRTKILVNLLREKYDDNAMRYILAAHNRVLIVTEPTLQHTRFESGVHLVEAPPQRLATTICDYLQRDDERQRIVENAYQLVVANAQPGKAVVQMIDKALEARSSQASDAVLAAHGSRI